MNIFWMGSTLRKYIFLFGRFVFFVHVITATSYLMAEDNIIAGRQK